MDKNEIDKMFDAFTCENFEELLQLAGMDVTADNVSKLNIREEEIIKLLYQRLMKRIENGNVEYFLLRMLNNYVDLMRSVRILEHSTDVSTSKILEKIIGDNREMMANMYQNSYTDVIFDLIIATNDSDYIKSIIDSKEKRKKLNLNDEDIVHLIVATDDPDYMKKYLDEIGNEDITIEYNEKVVLPEDMTIGIEIESEGENSVILRNLSGFIEKGWEHKNDGSLSNGIEIVSPILTGDNEKTSNSIKNVCTYLNKLRTDCIRKMWGTYSYRCRLFNYTKELDEFNRNMGKYRKNIIYNKQ